MVVRRYFERHKEQGTRSKKQGTRKAQGSRSKERGKTRLDTKFPGSLPHRGNMSVGL